MELKVYKCCIDDNVASDLEVNFVALVDRPAIEKNFLAFKNQKESAFAINLERRIISGPAMLADFPIYRKDDEFGEYYVVFDKGTIMQIVQKFFKKGFIQNFNLLHQPGTEQTGLTIFESLVTDSDRGILPMKGFEDAGEGSWFISAKVEDDDIWDKIKDGTFKGFSVEGIFQYVKMTADKPKMSMEEAMLKIERILNETDIQD